MKSKVKCRADTGGYYGDPSSKEFVKLLAEDLYGLVQDLSERGCGYGAGDDKWLRLSCKEAAMDISDSCVTGSPNLSGMIDVLRKQAVDAEKRADAAERSATKLVHGGLDKAVLNELNNRMKMVEAREAAITAQEIDWAEQNLKRVAAFQLLKEDVEKAKEELQSTVDEYKRHKEIMAADRKAHKQHVEVILAMRKKLEKLLKEHEDLDRNASLFVDDVLLKYFEGDGQ